MNAEQEFFTKLVALAKLVGGNFELKKEAARLYDEHLSPFGYERVCKALDQIILSRNSRDPFPSIKEIRSLIQPEADPESEAIVIASRIVTAVAKIGPYQGTLAREYMGDTGWAVVESEGGWGNVCSILTNENIGMLKAQWRNLAKSLINRSYTGIPALTSDWKKGSLSHFGVSPAFGRPLMTQEEMIKKADEAREFLKNQEEQEKS